MSSARPSLGARIRRLAAGGGGPDEPEPVRSAADEPVLTAPPEPAPAAVQEPEYYVKGIDSLRDLQHCLPGFAPTTVFDVGANVGQSAAAFAEAFPDAAIHCFEPVSSVFAELTERFAGSPNVRCTRCALGATSGSASIDISAGSTMHSLTAGPSAAAVVGAESVDVRTLDEVCRQVGVDGIDLLKIDTEGFDLEVLRGAAGLLAAQAVDVVEVEAGMNPENLTHVPFETLKRHLEEAGYRIFGIYEQKEEWPTLEAHLRRINAVFLSRRTIDRYQGHSPGSPP